MAWLPAGFRCESHICSLKNSAYIPDHAYKTISSTVEPWFIKQTFIPQSPLYNKLYYIDTDEIPGFSFY